MPRSKPSLVAFNLGEMGGHTLARLDIENYGRGAEIMENIIPLIQGGMEKSPGTDFIGVSSASDSDGITLLRPFIFRQSETYALEMTDRQMRFFYRGEALVEVGATQAIMSAWSDDSGAQSSGGGPPPSGGTGTTNSAGGGFSAGGGRLFGLDIEGFF